MYWNGIFIPLLALFGLSGLIGVYFWRKGNQTTPEETLLGKKLTENSHEENDKNKGWTQEMFCQGETFLSSFSFFHSILKKQRFYKYIWSRRFMVKVCQPGGMLRWSECCTLTHLTGWFNPDPFGQLRPPDQSTRHNLRTKLYQRVVFHPWQAGGTSAACQSPAASRPPSCQGRLGPGSSVSSVFDSKFLKWQRWKASSCVNVFFSGK